MTRKYQTQGPDGQPVEIPADLLEKIASDVRDFDRAESAQGRMAFSLKKISAELPRLRAAVTGRGETLEDRMYVRFRITALAVQVADTLGYTSDSIRRSHRVKEMLTWLGVDQ